MRNKIHKISKKTTTYENTTNQYVYQLPKLFFGNKNWYKRPKNQPITDAQ